MRRVISAALCAAALTAIPGTASAATNGQLVVVSRNAPNALITLNPDGSGTRTLWSADGASVVSSPAWSPDGNRIAFVAGGRIKTIVLAGGAVTDLAAGSDPGWTPNGADVAFRRGQALLAVPAGGGAERSLGTVPDANTQSLAWSPDGGIARSALGELRVDALDGAGEETLAGNATGRVDWSPDGELLAYAAAGLYVHYVRVIGLDGDGDGVTLPPDFYAADVDPSWAPDGERIVYRRINVGGGDQLRAVDSSGNDVEIPTTSVQSFGDPDWQPCVAGVTTSCTSVTPPQAGPAYRCANPNISVRSGQQRDVPFNCTMSGQAVRLGSRPTDMAILTQPAHGTAWIEGQRMLYRAAAGYVGADTFSVRAASGSMTSNDITVTVNVTPTLTALAAPRLTVLGKPKLDKHGRVVLRGTCTNVCDVALRVIVRLNTQRVLKGRIVKASAMPGATVRLSLQRAKLPKHRRIVSARISGTLSTRTVTGALLQRNFTLSLIP